ncbi:MAG: YkgJ family cysteine cluster protein [Promethearchaeota archaeon]
MVDICEALKGGADFECQGCGYCCSQKEGNIYIFPPEVDPIVKFLVEAGVVSDRRQFFSDFTTVVLETYHKKLMETLTIKQEEGGACTFLEGTRCRIYPCRPFQCLGFPFWRMNVEDCEAWEELKVTCPGIDVKGRHFTRREIEELLKKEKELEDDYYKLMKKCKFDIARVYPELSD